MRSELIEGVSTSELDPQIVQFISKHPCGAPPHMYMYVAIRNEVGEMYRLIIADGIVELIRVDKFLASMGCIEEFSDAFDALFRTPSSSARSFPGPRAFCEGIEPQCRE
ncbi:MAG TPA: hypothetical protein VGE93_23335 [Bryobacteraceae bacterium]